MLGEEEQEMGDPTRRTANGHVPPCGLVSGNQRVDWDVHREQVRRSNRARYRAVKELILLYPDEFNELHRICGALQDPPVVPKPTRTRAARVEAMEVELAELQARLEELGRREKLARLQARLAELKECSDDEWAAGDG